MSTSVYVYPGISTQINGAQSFRVPVPLPEDPYEAIRKAYLVGMDTESEPFEDPETETLESPTCHVEESEGSGTSGARSTSGTRSMSSDSTALLLPDHPLTHTTPVLVPSLYGTARMAVRVPSAMSPGLSVSIADVAAMSDSAFRKRFRSFYDSSPFPNFPVWKRYREYEDPVMGDEGLTAGDEGLGIRVEILGLDEEGDSVESDRFGLAEEEAVLEGQQRAVLVVGTAVSEPLGLGYGALRCRELALEGDHVYSTFEVGLGSSSAPEPKRPERVSAFRQPTFTTWIEPEDGMVHIDVPTYPPPTPPVQTPPSPEWSSGSFPISPAPSIVPLPISSPMISLIVSSQERTVVTFGALWRPMLALEAWAGHVDAQMTDMSWEGGANRKAIDREGSRGILERVVVIKLET
nr:hypothetical protein [Tanacetum cinerariifolium]